MMWALWWVWIAGAILFAIIEVLAPGFVFLGFAIGAAVTGLLLALGISASGPLLILVFAVVSLGAWLAMRRFFALRGSEAKFWDTDINDTDINDADISDSDSDSDSDSHGKDDAT